MKQFHTLLVCLLLATGCATSGIDAARIEFKRALSVEQSTKTRFRDQAQRFAEANIRRIGVHTPAAQQWMAEFRARRVPVEEQIKRCESTIDDASELILLSDDRRAPQAAKSASSCVSALRDMVAKLFDGGL